MGTALIEALRQKCAWCVQRISKEWVWDRGSHRERQGRRRWERPNWC